MAPRAFLGLLLFYFPLLALCQNTSFTFNGFNKTNLDLDGASVIKPSGVLKLTNTTNDYIGHAFYPSPITMYDDNRNVSSRVYSFSTCFVFAIRPRVSGEPGGYGLAFTVAPKTKFPEAEAEHFLGLFNPSNDGNASNHMLVVEFDTVNGYNDKVDSEGNHVGVNFNGMSSSDVEPVAYYINNTGIKEDFKLESGKPIQAWIEYDSETQHLNVSIAPLEVPKPVMPLLSVTKNLTDIFLEEMYVGFSAATGNKTSFHYVLGWSFRVNGPAQPLDPSDLPLLPNDGESTTSSPPYGAPVVGLIVGLCVLTVCLIGILVFFAVARKRRRRETPEDWELDCPHRFTYKDLSTATKGFNVTERVGIGGFGEVYHGVLQNGSEVAVKKITSNNALQGMREFVAEVESLGRLRHKNLVNLQGWCKYRNELLLIYDYVPHGSLFSLLFNRRDGFVLTWQQRVHVMKGIAAGLLYLHEEWEQVVIHRDVKSSNVLVDSDMNARLGDFGLARLHHHDQISHTTNVVGTVGYIAPELARSGKASAGSDVFAYGILLLEVACGAHPIGSGHFVLADRVLECHRLGRILDVVDERMGSDYDEEEAELVLKLGLLCSHPHDTSRPRMRQVVRYLNRDEPLPVLDGSIYSARTDPVTSRFLEAFSSDTINTSSSYVSSTVGSLSVTSLSNGR